MTQNDFFFNSFNARHLNPKEVADTFIWSLSFSRLIQNNHSVILGARGCGKTTLMKMLTLPALYKWKDERAEKIRKSIPFYAVYISTDIYWDVKNQQYSSQLKDFGGFADQISRFAVNTNVFKALCETFKDIIVYEAKGAKEETEIEFCKILIKAWKLPTTIPKLDYVIDALNERVDEVNQIIQEAIFNNQTDRPPHREYFSLSFESSIEYVIPIFQRLYGLDADKKWALCFDELEFAPMWLQQALYTSLRSRTQYILYKLSASPILAIELETLLTKEYSPTSGNDLQLIKMWGSSDTEDFSRKIISSILNRKYPEVEAEVYFGSNEIYNKTANSYNEGSDFYQQMVELIGKDQAFREFLAGYEIDLEKPLPQSDRQKDTIFRKIKPIVYFRNFYIDNNIKVDSGEYKTNLRSRKTSELYSGIEVLTKVCDGNPRWLIGIVSSLVSKSGPVNCDNKAQYNELMTAAKRFANVMANIPTGPGSELDLMQLIDRIGKHFSAQIVGKQFNMDPVGTFIVDDSEEQVSNSIINLLEKGVSQGSFILLSADEEHFDFKIRNQRFKLAYLFCPLYKLPLRKFPATNLSDCIAGVSSGNTTQNQIRLF